MTRVMCPWCGEVERPRDFLEALARMPARVYRAVRGLTEADLSLRPLPSEWSLREIIAHLADCEIALAYRLRKLLAEESPDIQPFDEKVWAERLAYDRRDYRTLLRIYRELIVGNLDLVRLLPTATWERTGNHLRLGRVTVIQTLTHNLDNDLDHLRQLATTRAEVVASMRG